MKFNEFGEELHSVTGRCQRGAAERQMKNFKKKNKLSQTAIGIAFFVFIVFGVVAFGFDDNPQLANNDLQMTSIYNTQFVIGVGLIFSAVLVLFIVYVIDYFYSARINSNTQMASDSRGSELKVLVVDDDPAMCNMLSFMLSAKGHQVSTYSDPTATPIIQELASGSPRQSRYVDAILVDYSMPNMNGLEFLKLLEERGCGVARGNKAVITAYGTNELRRELDQLGVKYFKKPFRLAEISQWLEGCATRVAQAG